MTITHRSRPARRGALAALAVAAAVTFPLTQAVAARAAAPATAASAVPSTAAGKLAASGCVSTAGAASCDLYAMAGTTQLLGTTVPIWGFSTSADAGTATAPGPVLVVDQGDTVTVTLHNQLSENVSLAFPGQPAGAFTGGVQDMAAGAAPSGSTTYTFTAGRPGTFLYEAGHTPGGARQVAMGLAGALVVRPTDGTAAGRSYDDEAVVVLSEIDPDLAAHPDTFDMRDFKPRYRLVNGRPFPGTDPINTDQGHTVLLRYVNAGTVAHSMSTLGATQLQLGQDGHRFDQPERETVAQLDAGTTADTLVTMPSGPESKVTLFEAGQHLDNDGRTEVDPTRVAMGGMMTFLDTAAPPDSTDHVGPVPAHVSLSPNPSDGKAPVVVTADLSDGRTGGSTVVAAELTVDDPDVAVGSGLPMTSDGFGAVEVGGATGTIPVAPGAGASCDDPAAAVTLECLPAGKHTVYVRALDSVGNWGVVGSAVLNLPKTGPATTNGSVDAAVVDRGTALAVSATGDDSDADGLVDGAEMWVDQVGPDGSGLSVAVNRSAAVVSEDAVLPAAPPTGETCATYPAAVGCLPEGLHHLLVHSHDSLGLWGPVLDVPFTVDNTGPTVLAAAVSPNPTNGAVSSPGNTGFLKVSGLVADQDGSGAVANRLSGASGYLAPASTSNPGPGFQMLAVDGRFDSPSEQVYGLIPLSQVKTKADGTYQVYLRGRDEAGNWGEMFGMPLVVDKVAPLLAAASGSPSPTNGAPLLTLTAPVTRDTSFQTAEFWVGTTDPGVGRATRVSVSYVDGKAVVTVPLQGVPAGAVRFNLRVQDLAGNWSNASSATVTVTKPNAVFADTFDAGGLDAWSARTNLGAGSMTVSSAAGIPAAAGNQGLAVTGSGTHYVTDDTPVAETGYHARFGFSPNTFTSGTSVGVTVLSARSGTADVVDVQYRRSAGTHQVRVVMARSGAAAVTGAWVNLAAGSHQLRVDWVSASAGSLKLSVDGAVRTTLTGNTSTLRVESARLGLVAGLARTSTGTAYIDSFESTRTTLP